MATRASEQGFGLGAPWRRVRSGQTGGLGGGEDPDAADAHAEAIAGLRADDLVPPRWGESFEFAEPGMGAPLHGR